MPAPKGNKHAANHASFRDALRYEIAKLGRSIEGDDVALVKGMRAMASPLVEAAATDKDLAAVKEIADRMDGKATQSQDIMIDGVVDHNMTIDFLGRTTEE